jgi:anti-sigma factor RsiW
MNCRQIVELMTDYLEGALSESDRKRFEAHLSGCDGCTEYLEQLRITMRLAARIADQPVPAELEAELLQAFREWKSRP